jgi:hypothetical protein
MREGHRFRFLLAMNCQGAAVAAEGAEAPYSKAPAVLEYGAVLPTNFLGLRPLNPEPRTPNPDT